MTGLTLVVGSRPAAAGPADPPTGSCTATTSAALGVAQVLQPSFITYAQGIVYGSLIPLFSEFAGPSCATQPFGCGAGAVGCDLVGTVYASSQIGRVAAHVEMQVLSDVGVWTPLLPSPFYDGRAACTAGNALSLNQFCPATTAAHHPPGFYSSNLLTYRAVCGWQALALTEASFGDTVACSATATELVGSD